MNKIQRLGRKISLSDIKLLLVYFIDQIKNTQIISGKWN